MFSEEVIEAAKKDALENFPRESCGFVTGGKYVSCVNAHADPHKAFTIEPEVINPHIIDGSLQAVIHSHAVTAKELIEKSCPSSADMRSQVSLGVPFGVIDTDGLVANSPYWWGDFKLDEPLLGVDFHHGVDDCYSIVRKWYWQKRGIKLPEFPRDDGWWENDKSDNLYIEGFEKAGFYQISREHLSNGDVILGKIKWDKINHAGIFLDNPEDGNFLILHHLPKRLSARVPAGIYLNKAELFLRYRDAD